jgi:hypothetical protein
MAVDCRRIVPISSLYGGQLAVNLFLGRGVTAQRNTKTSRTDVFLPLLARQQLPVNDLN